MTYTAKFYEWMKGTGGQCQICTDNKPKLKHTPHIHFVYITKCNVNTLSESHLWSYNTALDYDIMVVILVVYVLSVLTWHHSKTETRSITT